MTTETAKAAFADYSEWLKQGENLENEDRAWLKDHTEERQEVSAIVQNVISSHNVDSMVEFGCGAGWLGNMIQPFVSYTGIDANEGCLALANERKRNPMALYLQGDIRKTLGSGCDLVCAFSFLKHFGLHEWEGVMDQFFSFAPLAVFTLQLTDGEDEEDGTEYHHVWIGPETLKGALRHHEVLLTREMWKDPNSDKRDVLFVVKRKA